LLLKKVNSVRTLEWMTVANNCIVWFLWNQPTNQYKQHENVACPQCLCVLEFICACLCFYCIYCLAFVINQENLLAFWCMLPGRTSLVWQLHDVAFDTAEPEGARRNTKQCLATTTSLMHCVHLCGFWSDDRYSYNYIEFVVEKRGYIKNNDCTYRQITVDFDRCLVHIMYCTVPGSTWNVKKSHSSMMLDRVCSIVCNH
jgi:hypothetical protein